MISVGNIVHEKFTSLILCSLNQTQCIVHIYFDYTKNKVQNDTIYAW